MVRLRSVIADEGQPFPSLRQVERAEPGQLQIFGFIRGNDTQGGGQDWVVGIKARAKRRKLKVNQLVVKKLNEQVVITRLKFDPLNYGQGAVGPGRYYPQNEGYDSEVKETLTD